MLPSQHIVWVPGSLLIPVCVILCHAWHDVLITGPDESGHMVALKEVLRRMEQASLRLSKGKLLFMVPSVEYLGYKIDADGLYPLPEKV